MPLTIENCGSNNHFAISADSSERLHGTVRVHGDNNRVLIGRNCTSIGTLLIVMNGSNSKLNVDEDCQLADNQFQIAGDSVVSIGRGTRFEGSCLICLYEPSQIKIGSGCLFGNDTTLATGDMHSVIDVTTGVRTNQVKDMIIEDRVWVGPRVLILNGFQLGTGAVVGIGTVLTMDVPAKAFVAGNPPRIIRTDITWQSELI